MSAEATHRTQSRSCPEHPEYLEALALAQGEGRALPGSAPGCALCAANLRRYALVRDALLASEGAVGPVLSRNWQAGVWLRLGREHRPGEVEAGGVFPASAGEGQEGVEEAVPEGRIVRFPRARPGEPKVLEAASASASSAPARSRRLVAFSAAGGILLAAAVGVAIAQSGGDAPAPAAAPHTLWRGEHMIQPANPPLPLQAQASEVIELLEGTPVVELKAYALDANNEDDPVDTLQDGSLVASGARLSFDYAISDPRQSNALRYLTVVAVVQSQDAQEHALPEGKQLLWLVESRPIQGTDGKLNVLEEEEVRLDAPPGELTIFGLFSHEPVPPRSVEDAFLLHTAGPSALPGVGVAHLSLTVAPGGADD